MSRIPEELKVIGTKFKIYNDLRYINPVTVVPQTRPITIQIINPDRMMSATTENTDVMIGSGGGIHAHPKGPVAGARAFRQAIDIGMNDMAAASEDFEDYVEDHEDEYPELAQAMETWGVSDTRF